MTLQESELGWYYIDEVWNLFIDGELTEVHVDFIEVDEQAEGEGYVVCHYGRDGDLITGLSLEAGDIRPVIRDLETTDRPWHI